MVTKIQKWGNSLAIRVPINLSKSLGLFEGKSVTITQSKDSIIIKASKPVYNLKDLLKGMTRKKAHPLVDWGEPVGKEVW